MSTNIAQQRVHDLIDDQCQAIKQYQQVQDPAAEYNFAIESSGGIVIHVIKNRPAGPLEILGRVFLPNDVLQVVRGSRQLQFMGEIGAVLVNAPGVHRYIDQNENTVSIDQFEGVELRHWIYPDGVSQHGLMTAIVDFVTALSYIPNTAHRIHQEASSGS